MSTLLDALQPEVAARCKVGRWLDQLADDETEALDAALMSTPVYAVHTRLAKAGQSPCSPSVWARHWTGVCSCP